MPSKILTVNILERKNLLSPVYSNFFRLGRCLNRQHSYAETWTGNRGIISETGKLRGIISGKGKLRGIISGTGKLRGIISETIKLSRMISGSGKLRGIIRTVKISWISGHVRTPGSHGVKDR